jgi:hypothetical protein
MDQSQENQLTPEQGLPAPVCSPLWYGVGAFFVTPVTALFCVLMGLMLILAWPFIPFLCYFQKKEEIRKANTQGQTAKTE